MPFSYLIQDRANNQCELCSHSENLGLHIVYPKTGESPDEVAILCNTCTKAIEDMDVSDQNQWRFLSESIWSSVPAVQVLSYRMLKLISAPWAAEILDMVYLDETLESWANEMDEKVVHKDSNGNILTAGDTVTLIQDLNVKGANFIAKRGTAVKRIRLVSENPEHIEGKVDGQQIVILTKFVKKN